MHQTENALHNETIPAPDKPKRFKKLKLFILVLMVSSAIFGITYGVCTYLEAIETYKIINKLNGKLFVKNFSDYGKTFYSFKDGKMAYEQWWEESEIKGDISQFHEIQAKPTTFQEGFRIVSNNNWLRLYISNNGEIMNDTNPDYSWEEITPSEMTDMAEAWNQQWCSHQFENVKVVYEATCSKSGKEFAVCKKCQYRKTWETDPLPHEYKNDICKVCGADRPALKAPLIHPDTWYTHDTILHYKNCKLNSPTEAFDGMLISYYPVCRSCNSAGTIQIAQLKRYFPVDKNHKCPYCNQRTVVQLEIDW